MKWRNLLATTAVTTAVFSLGVPHAFAAKSVSSGSTSCTVESLAPTVAVTTKGKVLTGSARVWCTAATTVTVRIYVGELDLTAEQIAIAETSKSVAVSRTTSTSKPAYTVITTSTVMCPNTEIGNEEFRSNAKLSFGTASTDYDRTIPLIDQYSC